MKRDNKGFSLIELIVVIAIMAILVGVMAPNVMKYIDKAREANDNQTLQAIYTAVYTSMLDPTLTSKPASTATSYTLPATIPTDVKSFDYNVYEIIGDVSGNIKFQSKAAGGSTVTAASVTVELSGNDVKVHVGTLGIDKNGSYTATPGGGVG